MPFVCKQLRAVRELLKRLDMRFQTNIILLIALSGCPKDEIAPRQACEDTAAAVCERFYACLSPTELASKGFPSTEAACVVKVEAQEGCAAQTTANVCDGNERYHGDKAEACADQIEGMSCSQLRAGQTKIAAPACGEVCTVD